MKKKTVLFFAIIIAMLSFTACNDGTTTVAAPTELTVDGPGIIVPGDSVYFDYQVPVLGRWLDCNLKNQGNKKLLGWLTKGVWKKAPDKYISDDELNAHKYSYTGDKGVVVDKATLKNTATVTIGSDGTVTPEASSNVDPAKVKQTVTQAGIGGGLDSYLFGLPLLYWLGIIALILGIILMILKLKDRNQNPPVNNPSGTGTSNGQAAVITVGNNANAKIDVAGGVTTITHNN
jgi:hypothetical protein